MINVYAENYNGEIIQITDSPYFDLIECSGLDPTDAALTFTDLAGMDGALFSSGRRTKRNIVFIIVYKPPIEANRNLVYKLFPTNKNIRLFFETDSKSVHIDGILEKNNVNLFAASQRSSISILCGDPYFKDTNGIDTNFSNTVSLFTFPFSIPEAGIEFSTIETETQKIINSGEIETGAIFTLTATTSQILNPIIYNNTTNQFFGLNVDLDQGDVITISTYSGKKSALLNHSGIITNVINERQSGSTWLQLVAGENIISYSCDEGANNLRVNVKSAAIYEGV